MTSLLLGSQQLTSRSGSPAKIAHPNRPLEGLADASEMGPSKLLRIARELAYGAQNWPGMKKPARRVWDSSIRHRFVSRLRSLGHWLASGRSQEMRPST